MGSVLATDPDGANNGIVRHLHIIVILLVINYVVQVSYGFAENTAASVRATFSLDPSTGVLELLTPINFEIGPIFYDFSVVAMDGGSPALNSTAAVRYSLQ